VVASERRSSLTSGNQRRSSLTMVVALPRVSSGSHLGSGSVLSFIVVFCALLSLPAGVTGFGAWGHVPLLRGAASGCAQPAHRLAPQRQASGGRLTNRGARALTMQQQPQINNELADERKIVAAASAIGLVTGLSVGAFKSAVAQTRHFTYEGAWSDLVDWVEGAARKANIIPAGVPADVNLEFLFYPLLGGIITSLIIVAMKNLAGTDFGPPLAGQLEETQRNDPLKPARVAGRNAAAVAALGSGCSLGPEGPSVEIGVSTSRVASQLLNADEAQRKVLASAGAAAGVSAGFNAPLTGVVFALEILLPSLNAAEQNNAKGPQEMGPLSATTTLRREQAMSKAVSSKSLAGAVLMSAAISCLCVRSGIIPFTSERFTVATPALTNTFLELPFYMTLGIMTGGVSTAFRRLAAESKSFYSGGIPGFEFMAKIPAELKPIIAASLCGVVATKYPGVLFFGYETVNALLAETSPYIGDTGMLLSLLALKVTLTASCVGSGLMGGTCACGVGLCFGVCSCVCGGQINLGKAEILRSREG